MVQDFGQVYDSFNDLVSQHPTSAFGSDVSNDMSGMSVLNASFTALVENTDRQDALIAELRSKVEFQPDEVLEVTKKQLPHCREWFKTPNITPGGIGDMRKFVSELEELQQEAYDRKNGKHSKTQKNPVDLTDVQLRTGTPSHQTPGDPNETPEIR